MRETIKIFKLSVLFVFVAAAVHAGALMEIDQSAFAGGTLAYAGGATPLVGTGIMFDGVTVTGAPLNNGGYTCVACTLSFTTGNATTTGPGLWRWGGGGSFTLTGNILGTPLAGGGPHVILSGSFLQNPGNFAAGGGSTLNFFAFGVDEKNPDLLAFFGIANNDWQFNNTEISAEGAVINADGSFTALVTDADLTNREVPIPGTATLMLLGLAALGVRRRS